MTDMDAELVALARTVDPSTLGQRVREARLAQGLTQGQLAGTEMSTAYVSRIESGQRRPDPSLLEGLAARLGASVDSLLLGTSREQLGDQRLALDWAQLSLSTGDVERALAGVDAVLAAVPATDVTGLRRDALHLRALALEASGRTQDAIMLLEDLAEAGPVDVVWARGLIVLSRSYRETGDLARAIETGERAQAPLAEVGLENSDEAIRLTLSLAASYFERGDADYAARLSRRALVRAEEAGSATAKAASYWNASIMESMRGRADAALQLANKAIVLLEVTDDARQVARLRTQLGMLELSIDDPDPDLALSHLQQAESQLAHTDATPLDLVANRVFQARAHFSLGNFEHAAEVAQAAREACREEAPLIAAQASALVGQIAASRGEGESAARAYQEAAMLLSSAGDDHGTAQLWFELATLLEDTGDDRGALDAYRRAAVSTGLRAPLVKAGTPRRSLV